MLASGKGQENQSLMLTQPSGKGRINKQGPHGMGQNTATDVCLDALATQQRNPNLSREDFPGKAGENAYKRKVGGGKDARKKEPHR